MSIQDLLLELKSYGLTDAEIGIRVNAPQSIISRLRSGTHKTTSYQRGIAIQALHSQVTSGRRPRNLDLDVEKTELR